MRVILENIHEYNHCVLLHFNNEKFMSRNGLSLRRKTTVGQHDPAQLIDRLISYVLHLRRLLKTIH